MKCVNYFFMTLFAQNFVKILNRSAMLCLKILPRSASKIPYKNSNHISKQSLKIKYYNFVVVELLRKILFPVSLLYAMVVRFRNYCYDKGVFKSKSFRTPIICVGNLSVGGTGKTPMIEFLVSLLKKEFKVAVLSRGYRRKSLGFILADSDTSVEALGDEPFQIYTKFPEITVAVDADRQNGISILEDKKCADLILLDDAFQHRKVRPDFSILLTAYGNLYTDDWYLPTGNLRDSKQQAKRADVIVVTKCPTAMSEAERKSIEHKLNPESHQRLLFSRLSYSTMLKGSDGDIHLEGLKHKKITLVTGIANPEPLLAHLKKEGVVFDYMRFKDHHFFTENELNQLREKECILTTEKDYARLSNRLQNLYFIAIKHEFSNADKEILENRLKSVLNSS